MYVQKLKLVEQELSNPDRCVHMKSSACNTLTSIECASKT